MKPIPSSADESNVLTPSLPQDLGDLSQRQRIFEAMARSCTEKSFSATTIADIVGHASISRATFYRHFANKRACFDATTESLLAELGQTAEVAGTPRGKTSPDTVRSVLKAVLELLAAKPDYAQILLVEAPNVDPQIVLRFRAQILDTLSTQERPKKGAPGADPEIAFGRAKVLITDYLAAGKVAKLLTLLPELVYIALLPYQGQDIALEHARLSQ